MFSVSPVDPYWRGRIFFLFLSQVDPHPDWRNRGQSTPPATWTAAWQTGRGGEKRHD